MIQFRTNWQNIYKNIVKKAYLHDLPQSQQSFQNNKVKQLTHHFILKTTCILSKKVSEWITAAQQKKSITLPFRQQSFYFCKKLEGQFIAEVDYEKGEIRYIEECETWKPDLSKDNNHLIVINAYPICRFHSLVVPFLEKKLPQQMTKKLLELSQKTAILLPQFILGFNSMGASSSVNNFHLHLIKSKELIGQEHLPIEKYDGKCVFSRRDKNSQKMYDVDVIENQIIFAFVFRSYCKIGQNEALGVQWQIIRLLTQMAIPFNMMWVHQKLYLMPRKFSTAELLFGWVELVGVILAKTEEEFDKVEEDEIIKKKIQLKIEIEAQEKIKNRILSVIKSFELNL